MQVVCLAGAGNISREVGKEHKEGEGASAGSTIKAATATGNQILTPLGNFEKRCKTHTLPAG